MKYRLFFAFFLLSFLAGCSLFGGNKDTKNLVADGLTPKELYEQAEDKVDAGSIEQAIDQYETLLFSYPGSKYCLLYTSPSPRDRQKSRMPSSA